MIVNFRNEKVNLDDTQKVENAGNDFKFYMKNGDIVEVSTTLEQCENLLMILRAVGTKTFKEIA